MRCQPSADLCGSRQCAHVAQFGRELTTPAAPMRSNCLLRPVKRTHNVFLHQIEMPLNRRRLGLHPHDPRGALARCH
jgi:hypothetical protein